MVVKASDRDVKLQWGKTENPILLRYKRADENAWKQIVVKNNSTVLKDLSGLYDYELQSATICKNDTSDWTASVMLYSSDRMATVQR